MTLFSCPSGQQQESLVRQVPPAAAWVAQNAGHVRINVEKIGEYQRFLFSKYSLITQFDNRHFVSADREASAAYVLALDSINFGSGYFQFCEGFEYASIAEGLKGAFERGEFNTAEKWMAVTPEYLSRIFGVPQNAHPELDRLLSMFVQHLKWTAEKIASEYDGKVLNLLEAAGYSAVALVDIVCRWESFRDVWNYKGRDVPVLKRAQILAADMNLALGGMKDLEALTMFADNMVPHVLQHDGILEYDAGLVAKIDSGICLAPGSDEEIEVRMAAIHAVELIKQAASYPVTSVQLDHILWNRGYEPALYAKPRHRTLTAAY